MRRSLLLVCTTALLGVTMVTLASASPKRDDAVVACPRGDAAGANWLSGERRHFAIALFDAQPDQPEQRQEPEGRLEPAVQHDGHAVQPGGSADVLPERPDAPELHAGRRRHGSRHGRRQVELQGPRERPAHAAGAAVPEQQRAYPVVQHEAEHDLQRPAGRLDRRAEREDGRSGLDDVRDRGGHLRRRDRRGVGAVHDSTTTSRAPTASSSRRRTGQRARSAGTWTPSTRRRASWSGGRGTCRIRRRSRTS